MDTILPPPEGDSPVRSRDWPEAASRSDNKSNVHNIMMGSLRMARSPVRVFVFILLDALGAGGKGVGESEKHPEGIHLFDIGSTPARKKSIHGANDIGVVC